MTDTTAAPAPAVWGQIQGQDITFPMEVDEFDAATLVFSVPAEAAQALLPGDAFEVVATDGVAQFVLALCDYHQNPWGDYLELNLGFLARPAGAGDEVLGSFVYRMPVDQAFTCEAGNEVMGFPKTVEELSVTHADGRVTFAMTDGGAPVLSVSFPAVEAMGEPSRVETGSYSYLHGVPHETPLAMDLGTGLLDPATVVIELGSGPVADELRSLGLPKAPDFGTWGTGLSATFQLGSPL
ncbi:acetoacetate decarboxylase family protein [Aquihabitans sp. G128]|uniref:acetoacetate decarboxylase family protein n=1 Tax=Aquihabitans sp. G128 TaxID=2849779 RepID=UPI001C243698|nr:acetoacetate decarboxylase family protein [Aquihabitans sp. G128]QXC60924.1 acetoacetate decarboxylase family protein [Aquihabitans sp. G128]